MPLALASREAGLVMPWRAEARTAIELNARMAEAYVLLADSFFAAPGWGCGRDRDADPAERYYRTATELDPRFALAYGNLVYHLRARAYTLERVNRLDEADRQTRELIKNRAPSVEDRRLLATIQLRRGDRERGSHGLEEAGALRRDTTTELSTARAYIDAGDIGDALPHLEQAFTMQALRAYRGWARIVDGLNRVRREARRRIEARGRALRLALPNTVKQSVASRWGTVDSASSGTKLND